MIGILYSFRVISLKCIALSRGNDILKQTVADYNGAAGNFASKTTLFYINPFGAPLIQKIARDRVDKNVPQLVCQPEINASANTAIKLNFICWLEFFNQL